MTDSQVVWLTPEAHARLTEELEHLKGPGRTEIAERIAAARDEGDLKENGGYHAARETQALQEARIRELQAKLDRAKIGTPDDDGVVEPGMVVTAKIDGKKSQFLLGSREVGGDTDLDVFTEASPLGQAINGKSKGEVVSYTAPNGREIKVEILDTKPFAG